MKCPTCTDIALVMTDRQGVEIDYCPQCRGVWLDRGELDKLIDRAAPPPARRPDFADSDHSGYHGNRYPAGRRKKSWLSDIFD
jgi:Zn-finger nucleic acid-binding protein